MLTDRQLRAMVKDSAAQNNERGPERQIAETLPGKGSGSLLIKVARGIAIFYFRQITGGKRKMIKLGVYRTSDISGGITLSQARDKAAELSNLAAAVGDVKEHFAEEEKRKAREKATKKAVGTLENLCDEYVADMKRRGRTSHKSVEKSLQRHVINAHPDLAALPAKDISKGLVRSILAKMIEAGIETHTNRVRAYLHAAYNYGLAVDDDPAVKTAYDWQLVANPVAVIKPQRDFERTRERVLTEAEIKALWNDISSADAVGFVVGQAIRFALAMGGQRIKQYLAAPWSDFDLDEGLVTIRDRKGRSARERVHVVPLTKQALQILKDLAPLTGAKPYPFIGGSKAHLEKPLHHQSIPTAITRYHDWKGTPNDQRFVAGNIRATCKTLMSKAGIDRDLRNRWHNHALNDVASRHYDKHDYLPELRKVAERWSLILGNILKGKEAGKVVKLKG